ncbi:MAG: hypothetical protein UZ17_ACD001001161 [Acidobacteria bacterium OLB17]|nr:MAG: hypothetical protein UZ17_ACD001001161 [Acidobacteria bacterium OLB17]MCZ2391891.1 hypothetical protein [Acidobacteriota bacterium]
MTTTTIRRNTKNKAGKKAGLGLHFRIYATMVLAGAIVVSGFFLAATQHFSFWDLSIKNSRLRDQIEELRAEKRRLLVAREVSLSPDEIKKAAERTSSLVAEPQAAVRSPLNPSTKAEVVAAKKEPSKAGADAVTTVVKTTFVRPAVQANAPVQVAKRTNPESERRRVVANAE